MRVLVFLIPPALALFLFFWSNQTPPGSRKLTLETGERRYHLLAEVALTPEKKAQGLMGRGRLADDEAMLFPFDGPGRPTFWMKNMVVPIDMIFIREDGVIDTIEQRIVPCKVEPCLYYTSENPTSYVLEVRSGFAEDYGVKVGDTVSGL